MRGGSSDSPGWRERSRTRAGPPAGLASPTSRASVRLLWSKSSGGDDELAGYRVYRGGRLFKRVRGLSRG